MAGRFPLYADADIRGSLIAALKQAGWDVLRAIDVHPEGAKDPVHFEEAAKRGRVLVSHDVDQLQLALQWISAGRAFTGFLTWPQRHHRRWSDGEIVEGFEGLAVEDDPFPAAYPIRYLKPARRQSNQ